MSGLIVGTYFWSDPEFPNSYTSDDVRRLQRAVSKNLTVPHEFVVVTDKPALFVNDSNIRAILLDLTTHVSGTCFVRLMTFHPEGKKLFGAKRFFQMDLDTLVIGNFDHVVNRDNPVVLWRNPARAPWEKPKVPGRPYYNGSFVLHELGSHPGIWRNFLKRGPKPGDDQGWYARAYGPFAPYWDQKDGIYRIARPGEPETGIWGDLPENACLVTCPGSEGKPSNPMILEANPWLEQYLC
jgi:hypothetical protein